MQCHHFDAGRCRSCTHLPVPYADQVARAQAAAQAVLADVVPAPVWEPPTTSREAGFRTKAKMVVAGRAGEPTLGILGPDGAGVDLRDCPLYSSAMQAVLAGVADLVARLRLTPYDVPARVGELKHVLVTESPDGEFLVRFVLRSRDELPRLRAALPELQRELPQVRVVTANLQPVHQAILEGPEEDVLTPVATLPMDLGAVRLHLGPRSFFQTNTDVARALYAAAVDWTRDLAPRTVLDLYCGVGGFALHLAGALPEARVHGVEVSVDAVHAARRSAAEAGLVATFAAADATDPAAVGPDALDVDLLVVNPPRRGIGDDLAAAIAASPARAVLYSSCHPGSLARDLAVLTGAGFTARRARLLDMFPHTDHAEVLVLLQR
ncbi:methyltransferase domain-containing protein [Nocardioides sp.]|uniref:methyltransferase domain-containing protein n=1 Tax=Nocardioides sp. TaxID=35761 RepID=UPI0035121D1F